MLVMEMLRLLNRASGSIVGTAAVLKTHPAHRGNRTDISYTDAVAAAAGSSAISCLHHMLRQQPKEYTKDGADQQPHSVIWEASCVLPLGACILG
jgi:hypothetical protein